MAKMPSEEVQRLLKEVVKHFDKEDIATRERQIRTWRRLKLFWEGFQRAWYSEVAHDWRIWNEDNEGSDTEQAYYDKPVNVFRAYLESIIAALSVTVPPITCYPDDADNTLDLATAKAGDKIAELLYRHNNVQLLWLHALFIFCTEGMVAAYHYPYSDEKYGTYDRRDYEEIVEEHMLIKCPGCGYVIQDIGPESANSLDNPEEMVAPMNPQLAMQGEHEIEHQTQDAFMPEHQEQDFCPACNQLMTPEVTNQTFITTRLVGITKEPKTRICMDAFGGLYVKVPNYARKQADCPYLIWAYETHYANVIEEYEHLHDVKWQEKLKASKGPRDPYEEWGRLNPQFQGEYPLNTITVRNAWLRPAAFNILKKEDADKLKKLYPLGVKVVLANEEFAEACPEQLDDYWTLTYNPLSDYLQYDPLGLLLVSIQEITNDLISLILQTIEHGIGQTFADPTVLNFNAYRQLETVPGGIYEAKPKTGQSLSQGFHEIKTASLSPEVMPFGQQIQNLAQLVSGALPSLFGGAIEGSETASQYSMSRSQALQRLQNTWKIFCTWWKEVNGKAIPMFINEVKDDERDVKRDKDGNFINVFIRKADLEGKIGKIELEANENLPLTWSQQKDVVMQLLQTGQPEILAILGAPENLPVIREAIGLTDFFVPGEDDREQQYDEIKQLLNSEPIPTGDPMMPEMPSVDIDPLFNDNSIHFEIVKKWATSEAGRQAKVDNPAGYKNVLLHGKLHHMQMQQDAMQQAMTVPGSGANPEKPNHEGQEAPITGEENVATV